MPPLTRVALRAAVLLMLLASLLWLAGCGGGGDDCRDGIAGPPAPGFEHLPACADDGRARIAPPNCTTHPERCS
jgi:hypothetical protein